MNRSGAGAGAGADSARECGNAEEPRARVCVGCVRKGDGALGGMRCVGTPENISTCAGRRWVAGRVRVAYVWLRYDAGMSPKLLGRQISGDGGDNNQTGD